MASLGSTKFTLSTSEYRACTVCGVKAIFHRWVDKEDIFIKTMNCYRKQDVLEKLRKSIENSRIITGSESIERVRNTVAIVEFGDGHIEEVKPVDVIFQDTGDLIWSNSSLNRFFYPEGEDDYKKDI